MIITRGDFGWGEVLAQNPHGARVRPLATSFAALWSGAAPTSAGEPRECPWSNLTSLSDELTGATVVAYGLTYSEHQNETRQTAALVRFPKPCVPVALDGAFEWRPFLDFEAEIGVLLHPRVPGRFGYCLLMDWTDRGIQVREHDPRDPGLSFARSKDFPRALGIGPVMALGGPELWNEITFELRQNGKVRQRARARDSFLNPELIWEREATPAHDGWKLIATGTPAGVLFRAPSGIEKLGLLLRSGLSLARAKERWLHKLTFLAAGDELQMSSPQLGQAHVSIQLRGDL
jgi:2-keto-4-pentenoate hydratase/2-oxohepta-3-ene-1,7-dioic acid hydratase in catechol pathway